jgi:hypothetical protein
MLATVLPVNKVTPRRPEMEAEAAGGFLVLLNFY